MPVRHMMRTPPLLRVPPFPGSRVRSMARAAPSLPLSEADLDQALGAIANARVGGEYWGIQPSLPQSPYTLVRVRDARVRAKVIQSLGGHARFLCWVDDASPGQGPDVVSGRCDPWHMIAGAARVIADHDDELVSIAAIAGLPVDFPDAGGEGAAAAGQRQPRDLLMATLGQHAYANPFTGEPMRLAEAVGLCAFWRALIDGNRPLRAAIGFAAWKQPTAAPLLWAGSDVPFVTRPRGVEAGAEVATWKSRVAPAMLAGLEGEGLNLVEVEDGFIRSVGLGADCVPPLSLVVDRRGAYFDPQRPSDLEHLLQHGTFPPDVLDRARRLRLLVVDAGISKYDSGHQAVERRAKSRRHVLVPGQVEDDRSVLCGGGAVQTNLDLLRRVRRDAPDAYILYKPHPDVEAGHRVGVVAGDAAAEFADEVVRSEPISALIDMVDEVHVNTSLAGFEALMRGTPVTTYGTPFYAGWGLTRDLGAVPERRTARRTLDEMVAAVLLQYPRYLDPVTGLPCPAEILVRRLAHGDGARHGPLVPLRRFQGYMKRRLASLRAR